MPRHFRRRHYGDFRSRIEHLIRDETECWEWDGQVDLRGYGNFTRNRKCQRTHRLAYELFIGPIPKGEGFHGTCVCHKCDNKLCFNPAHLFLGTVGDNNRDAYRKGRAALYWAKRTHCSRGHEYTEGSYYTKTNANGNPSRQCKECHYYRLAVRRGKIAA